MNPNRTVPVLRNFASFEESRSYEEGYYNGRLDKMNGIALRYALHSCDRVGPRSTAAPLMTVFGLKRRKSLYLHGRVEALLRPHSKRSTDETETDNHHRPGGGFGHR